MYLFGFGLQKNTQTSKICRPGRPGSPFYFKMVYWHQKTKKMRPGAKKWGPAYPPIAEPQNKNNNTIQMYEKITLQNPKTYGWKFCIAIRIFRISFYVEWFRPA